MLLKVEREVKSLKDKRFSDQPSKRTLLPFAISYKATSTITDDTQPGLEVLRVYAEPSGGERHAAKTFHASRAMRLPD